ncbi:TlpA disulfide reductase family protein [uncultured Draconibacterium sp.]|uniref:TlpA family protein disulfide reductase n=1 Tax=uncultured Draconibacterium sp. TaxID=1573823 RepID=UPI0025CD0DC1|nr:TlpA disulfide reductase family protein [uncultured Draconibacterium sp.]
MKPALLALFLFTISSFGVVAQTKTIRNPAYEFKNSGIYNVPKVVLNDTATLLTIHCKFVPHWWVQFNDNEAIRDSKTKQEYKVKGIQGAVFGQQLWMPNSGDSTVVLVFPPLPASTKKIDYQSHIFGISLDPAQSGIRKPTTVSPAIDQWMKEQLARAPQAAMPNYQLSTFFNEKPARLIGCIKGYDPRAGFSTGIVYAQNELTREEFPIVIKIEPDGRFEAEIPMIMPKHTMVVFDQRVGVPFYIEPGQTLCLVLDWEEFLTFDRRRNIRYQFNQIEFRGALASINQELMNYPASQFNYNEFDKKRKSMAPLDFKVDQLASYQKDLDQYENYLKEHTLSAKAQTLLLNRIKLDNANKLFNYTMSRDYYAKQDGTNKILKMPIPEEYYDFLKSLSLNDPSLLICDEFSEFINRYEYCELFQKAQSEFINNLNSNRPEPQKNILEYFDEEKIAISEEEREFLSISVKKQLTDDDMARLKQMEDFSTKFGEKYNDQIQKYVEKYLGPFRAQTGNSDIEIWKLKDSILVNSLGLTPNLAYEIAKTRSLESAFKNAGLKEKASELWTFLRQDIHTPYLVQTGNALFEKRFPETTTNTTKQLPSGPATEVFNEIIAPYKGKVLFVDFWATSCGPCVANIKQMKEIRKKYEGNPDFDFVFITDQRSSPEKNYNDLVKEQNMKNTYRISTDEFYMLRQLFRFNGIPHYVVIDQKGDVINDNFEMHNFIIELEQILPAYKKVASNQ